jgi:glutathione S-transferase
MILRLTGRPGSHFTRVATMVADELGLTLDHDVVHDLRSLDPAVYGGHPGLKVPTLHVDGSAVFGTENICRKLVALAGSTRVVLFEHVTTDLARNAQELVWHAMSVQVQLVIGLMFSKLPPEALLFAKARLGLLGTLGWLERHLEQVLSELPSPREVSVLEIALFCLVEHLVFRPTVPLDDFPRLRQFAHAFGARPSAQRTPYPHSLSLLRIDQT